VDFDALFEPEDETIFAAELVLLSEPNNKSIFEAERVLLALLLSPEDQVM